MNVLRALLFLSVLFPKSAGATLEGELRSRWDTIRFALSTELSDVSDATPALIVHRTEQGGTISYKSKSDGKLLSRSVTASEVDNITSQLVAFFKDAELIPPDHPSPAVDRYEMIILIDDGLVRMPYHKSIPMKQAEKSVQTYREFIESFTKKQK